MSRDIPYRKVRPMPNPAPLFTIGEYRARLARVREAMARDGLDALIVSDPSNINWITGYDGWSFYVHQAAVVFPDRDPLWWGRPQDVAGAAQTCWLEDDALFFYPEEHVQNPDAHPYETLPAILAENGLRTGRIGVEMDNYYFSAACMNVLRRTMPAAQFADATGLVNWRRAVKSPAEIALMERAARIVERMHAAVREALAPGVRKCDLVAEAMAAGVRGLPETGGDYPAIAPIAPSGREASAAHITWNDRVLEPGEATYFEIAGCRKRYHCPLSRTYFLGDLPDDMKRAEHAVLSAIDAALGAARPGAVCEEVAEAVYAAFRANGFEKKNRTGYPIGLSYPPDWGERTMSLRPGDRTVLEENMTFHLMPGLWTPDWGVAITESFVVTSDGGRALADTPREIFVRA
jgi:ectoine hydrolase